MTLASFEDGFVKFEKHDGVGEITFFHPSHNSMPGYLLELLAENITNAGIYADVKVIVLKSEGDRSFCAGASFDELMNIQNFEEGKMFFSGFAKVINAMRVCPKFIIGRVQGKAVGGGIGIAAATDYCFATKAASVKLSELAVGIGPFVVGPAVERKMGLSAMSQMAINATEFHSADWAFEKGLYNALFDDITKLDEGIQVLTNKLVQSNPEAMSMLKSVFWEGTDHWDKLLIERAEKSGKLVLSDFTRNAIAKFKAK
jgi:methylglutaconyl-CoA hydratase